MTFSVGSLEEVTGLWGYGMMKLWDVVLDVWYKSTRFRDHNLINSPFKILRCFHRIPRGWKFMAL